MYQTFWRAKKIYIVLMWKTCKKINEANMYLLQWKKEDVYTNQTKIAQHSTYMIKLYSWHVSAYLYTLFSALI